MTQQTLLDHDDMLADEPPGGGSFVRALVRVIAMSLVITAVVAGIYLVFAGTGNDPLAAADTNSATGTVVDKDKPGKGDRDGKGKNDGKNESKSDEKSDARDAKAEEPRSPAEIARAAAAALPSGLSGSERSEALTGYLTAVGFPLTEVGKPAAAAESACGFLADGAKPDDLVENVSSGGFSKAESRAFLLGATTLYCKGEAAAFR